MELTTQVQILNEAGCVSLCANALQKVLIHLLPHSNCGQTVEQTDSLNLGKAISLKVGKLSPLIYV